MDNSGAITQLTSLKGQSDNNSEALGLALEILTSGYQSDQEAITEAVTTRVAQVVDAAVTTATGPLNDQIVSLTKDLSDANDRIALLDPASTSVDPVPADQFPV